MATDTSTHSAEHRALIPHPHPWIWMYHSVADPADDPYGITVARDRLDRHLTWLRRRRLSGVDVGTLLRAHAAGRAGRLVGLTFDDGYADFLHEALPVLRRHEFTATVFVLPRLCGGSNEWDALGPRTRLLTAEEIRTAAAAGMRIGSHGLYHQNLTALSDTDLRQETLHSRELLREITGTAPDSFCYPYGIVDDRVADAVRAAGYTYGFAIAADPLLGPYALPRTHISHADRGLRLRAKRLRHRFAVRGLGR
ncbi:polysaccharide deacetylase family protein [Streptomyces sp. ISL-100]|uniref:polysaccharide deacetylase family protein n=1 Tax=Streptomyces sp. ISL-100 TaxID=2819173 RepID=UPI001BE97055|nr:polysaccharide deacetylase family protein [Streptomyces sp. ISL-100]MBT2395925.1 polysaccharide deacetylase family protein [Streptomyces sp. ISL-100]